MYEIFEHTADLGWRVEAPDLESLLTEAGRGLFSMIVENLDDVRPTRRVTVDIPGDDPPYLLFDWLAELLYLFDARHVVLRDFKVRIAAGEGLRGEAWGEPLDRERHRLDHEVKAITYHELDVSRTENGWQAVVIVDI